MVLIDYFLVFDQVSENENQIFHHFWEVVSPYNSVKFRQSFANLLAKNIDFL